MKGQLLPNCRQLGLQVDPKLSLFPHANPEEFKQSQDSVCQKPDEVDDVDNSKVRQGASLWFYQEGQET